MTFGVVACAVCAESRRVRYKCGRRTTCMKLYKGMDEDQRRQFASSLIPGFVADEYLAMIYSQPSLTGEPTDIRYIVSVDVDISGVLDLSHLVSDMCMDWRERYPELRDRVWAAPGSGHGGRLALYYGVPVRAWALEAVLRGDPEWERLWRARGAAARADLVKVWSWQE